MRAHAMMFTAIKYMALDCASSVSIKLNCNELLAIPDDVTEFQCILQVVNVPECILLEPALYHLQLSDGAQFINALLPFSGVDEYGNGMTWLYGEMCSVRQFSLVHVDIRVER